MIGEQHDRRLWARNDVVRDGVEAEVAQLGGDRLRGAGRVVGEEPHGQTGGSCTFQCGCGVWHGIGSSIHDAVEIAQHRVSALERRVGDDLSRESMLLTPSDAGGRRCARLGRIMTSASE
jgi:hypothetical protein